MNMNRTAALAARLQRMDNIDLTHVYREMTSPATRALRDPEAIINRTPLIYALAVRYCMDEAAARGLELPTD